jgi:NitT/TauT family transport system substrate-binding protein
MTNILRTKRTIPTYGAFILALTLGLGLANEPAASADKTPVSIRFSWKLKGEYAPLYVALDKGYFAAENLDVTLGEGTSSQTALSSIVQNQDQAAWLPGVFAVQAISNGLAVKVVGLYNAAAPNVLISRADKPVRTPADLKGKIVGHSVGDVGTTFIGVICKKQHIDCSSFKTVTVAAPARVPSLVAKKVDVVSAYTSNDLPILVNKFGPKAFVVMDPTKYGLRVMGASLAVSDAYLAAHRKVVAGLRRAIDRGFRDTLADPRAAAAIMLKHWTTALSLDVVTEQVKGLNAAVDRHPGKSIGWVDPQAIQDTLDALETAYKLKNRKPVDAYLDNSLVDSKGKS